MNGNACILLLFIAGLAVYAQSKPVFDIKLIDSSKHDSTKTCPNRGKCVLLRSYKGKRDKSEIAETTIKNMAPFQYAYGKRLKDVPDLKGKLTVKFGITPAGDIAYCSIYKSTLGDSILENIVVDKIKQWHFLKRPDLSDTAEVIFPFSFSR